MNNDKVSIVIPIYNSEKFLSDSIESAINQTYDNKEIIAIDDGSTDHSMEVLRRYENDINIIQQENRGLANALNASIAKISGRWLKWLSPDDVLKPNAVEILVNEAKKLPEDTIIYSNWELIDEENKKLRPFSESNYNNLGVFDFNIRLLDGQQINVNTTLIPSSLFKNKCMFQDLADPIAIDYDFFLRAGIIYNVKFHLIEKILLQYRIHSNQLSHKKISKSLLFLSDIKEKILSNLDLSINEKYQKALLEYQKTKSHTKKTQELGLKLATSTFPDWLSDHLLIFYLNKIRTSR